MILPGQYSTFLAGHSLTNATVLLRGYQCKSKQTDMLKVKELVDSSSCLAKDEAITMLVWNEVPRTLRGRRGGRLR